MRGSARAGMLAPLLAALLPSLAQGAGKLVPGLAKPGTGAGAGAKGGPVPGLDIMLDATALGHPGQGYPVISDGATPARATADPAPVAPTHRHWRSSRRRSQHTSLSPRLPPCARGRGSAYACPAAARPGSPDGRLRRPAPRQARRSKTGAPFRTPSGRTVTT